MKRKGLKKAAAKGNGMEKAWQARTEKTAARRLAAQFEQEARELGAAARLLRRRVG